MARFYTSKSVKIVGYERHSIATKWMDYFVEHRGKILNRIPFDTQKEAIKYIYDHGLLKRRNTRIEVVFKDDFK